MSKVLVLYYSSYRHIEAMANVVVELCEKWQEFQKLDNQDQDQLPPREHFESRKFEVRAAPLVGGRAGDILFVPAVVSRATRRRSPHIGDGRPLSHH